jgi:hypothetical protein
VRRWSRAEADRAQAAYDAVVRSGAFGATERATRREIARRAAGVLAEPTAGGQRRAWARLCRDLDAAHAGASAAMFPVATEAARLVAGDLPS